MTNKLWVPRLRHPTKVPDWEGRSKSCSKGTPCPVRNGLTQLQKLELKEDITFQHPTATYGHVKQDGEPHHSAALGPQLLMGRMRWVLVTTEISLPEVTILSVFNVL